MERVVLPIHGHEHCPGGPDPIPCLTSSVPFFRAYKWDADIQTITDGEDSYMTFDRYQTSDATKIQPHSWISGSPDVINRVNLQARGLYSITCLFVVDPIPAAGSFGLALEGALSEFYPPPAMIWTAPALTAFPGDDDNGHLAWTVIQSYPPIWREQTDDTTAPAQKQLRVLFQNFTGESLDILNFMLEIHLLYEFDYETAEGDIQSQA